MVVQCEAGSRFDFFGDGCKKAFAETNVFLMRGNAGSHQSGSGSKSVSKLSMLEKILLPLVRGV